MSIYGQEALFTDLLACLAFPVIPFFTQAALQYCKYDYIEASKDVGYM